MQHIGIGTAKTVESIEIKWPGNNSVQIFKNLQPNQFYEIKEGDATVSVNKNIKPLDFMDKNRTTIGCAPLVSSK